MVHVGGLGLLVGAGLLFFEQEVNHPLIKNINASLNKKPFIS